MPPAITLPALLEVADEEIGDRRGNMRLGQVRLHLARTAKAAEGFLDAVELAQRVAEVHPGERQRRIAFGGRTHRGLGFGQAAELAQRVAEIVPGV